MRTRLVAVLALVPVALTATAFAHSFPAKAPLLKTNLVQAYPQCTSPNVATSGGRPACLSTEEVDPSCLFGSKGFGLLTATIAKTSIKVKASLRGLDPGCEGKTLMPAFMVRTTTDDCSSDHCTVADYEIAGGSCTVNKGKCAVTTTIPSGYTAGAGSEMTVLTCGMKDGDRTAFTCGIMVK
jgi:hypothetical protein